MELPQKLTSDLKIVQQQMKLEIQTHQIMRIKQAKDPNNSKLHEDLREVEKRITSLGEKQNQLMKWLRKLLTAIPCNSALVVKTIAASLGIAVNGTHPSSAATSDPSSNNKCTPIQKNNSVHNSVKDQIQCNGYKTIPLGEKKPLEEVPSEISITVDSKDRLHNKEPETKLLSKNALLICSPSSKIGKHKFSQKIVEDSNKASSENNSSLSEPLTAEKERFLSAVGLVTRDILKELQNRRVERKRRSTANHTQFVYGSNWDISSKKRKKSNYLTSSAKQHITRQAARSQNPRSETPVESSKSNPLASIFKTPYPVSNPSQNGTVDHLVNTNTTSQKSLPKGLRNALKEECDADRICPPDLSSATYDCKPGDICFVCQKPDKNTIECSCKIHYHNSCAESVENCVGCGEKLRSNATERRAEKQRLQEMNNRLNSEKEELETRAAELSVILAKQDERKKKLLSMEEDVRRKIQRIHDFVAMIKNAQSVPSS